MRTSSTSLGSPLAQWLQMQETGRKKDPDQVRAVGVRLAAILPAIIAAATDPAKRRPVRRRVLP